MPATSWSWSGSIGPKREIRVDKNFPVSVIIEFKIIKNVRILIKPGG